MSDVTGEVTATAALAGEAQQFVVFQVNMESFAVPLAEVKEIIRMPAVVQVPAGPPALEGLANLRGTVLPIIRLRQAFGMENLPHDDATRVVVLDHGRPIGLVVDVVANVVTVEADRIETIGAMRSNFDADLLSGIIKARDGRSMVMILDAGKVIQREFRAIQKAAERYAGGLPSAMDQRQIARPSEAQSTSDERQLVSFEVAGQEYALAIERVQEIVQLPETVTSVPNSPAHVLGVITLRNRLLPIVSLRDMFGLPSLATTEANKVVVVSVDEATQSSSVGVLMDSVKEVLRVSKSMIEPMPALVSRGGDMGEIESICRLQDGKRLVSILSADRMFNSGELTRLAANAKDNAAMSEDRAQGKTGGADDEQQVVVFRLMDEEYGVPIEAVQEIVRVPEQLTRIPKTPDFIEGVVNLRGVVLPVIDQRRRFGMPGTARNDRQRIMVYTIKGVRMGFIVDCVSEVMRIPQRVIGPAPALSEDQQKLIRRVANLEKQKRMILLLDVDELLDVAELASVDRKAAAA